MQEKNAQKMQQGKKEVEDEKKPFKMVQTFPSAPVTFFSFQGIKCKKFSQEKSKKKLQKNAIYKGKKPL